MESPRQDFLKRESTIHPLISQSLIAIFFAAIGSGIAYHVALADAVRAMKNADLGDVRCSKMTVTNGADRDIEIEPGTLSIRTLPAGQSIDLGLGTGTSPLCGLYVNDASGTQRLAVGVAETTDTQVGGTQLSPESSITGFDQKSRMLYQLPGIMAIHHDDSPSDTSR